MFLIALMALVFAAVVGAFGVVVGTVALLLRGVLWIVFFPIRLALSLIALPFVLVALAIAAIAVVGVSLLGAVFVGLGVLAAGALTLALPLALVFGVCWLIARLVRRPQSAALL